ncbi:XdhC family protein [Nitrospirillum sp. BR 11828]|uniref:XdhC family protein n=1 Tax=Nitrospirillum sp. BR 11828 TaxID=3104325 RepID=UPI002ACAA54F|nr:XdhC family protein [Nitrospirillum sp. BR 11828]MDZ5648533.1 XdhC family protein [Nitrospirillum sp. BR 11828]
MPLSIVSQPRSAVVSHALVSMTVDPSAPEAAPLPAITTLAAPPSDDTPPQGAAAVNAPVDELSILRAVEGWLAQGQAAAIATVIDTWGSSPRPVGSKLAVDAAGTMIGSVSGGCVEGAVVEEALRALEDGEPRLLTFGVPDERAWEVGLACGGTVRIYVAPVGPGHGATRRRLLSALLAAADAKRPAALVTDLATGQQTLVEADRQQGETALPDDIRAQVLDALARDRSTLITPRDTEGEEAEGEWFAQVWNPPLRLVLVGAVHIAQALAPMARMAGYEVIVVDPRAAFASAARFPDAAGITLVREWPDDAVAALAPDRRTAVVTLTHDAKLDEPALRAALESDAFFIGALGSRKTHQRRLDRMADFGPTALERIHGPVGLDIGALTPAEIAVSILAQVTLALRGAKAERIGAGR